MDWNWQLEDSFPPPRNPTTEAIEVRFEAHDGGLRFAALVEGYKAKLTREVESLQGRPVKFTLHKLPTYFDTYILSLTYEEDRAYADCA